MNLLPPPGRGRAFLFATACVAAAMLMRLIMDPWLGRSVPYVMYYPAVMLAAWFGGFWPGMLAMALSGVLSAYFYLPPLQSLSIADRADLIALGLFLVNCGLISFVGERVRRAEFDHWKLAAIVSSSDDAIVGTTLDGFITSWNGGAERLFGYAQDEVLGQSITILIPDDRLREEDGVLARIRSGHRVEPFETVRRRKDGTLIDVSVTASPIQDRSGAIVGASKVARDITERRRTERLREELIERERRARDDALAARDRLGFLSEVGALLTSSLDYEETLDRAVHVALPRLGDYCNVLVQDDHGKLRHVAWGHVVRDKEPVLRELTVKVLEAPPAAGLSTFADAVMKSGKMIVVDHAHMQAAAAAGIVQLPPDLVALGLALRPYAYIGVPLQVRGRVAGVLSFGTTETESRREYGEIDVSMVEEFTRRVSLAVENARLFRHADELNRLKDEFLATLSHELRTPLAAVLGWSRMLASGQLDGRKAAQAIDAIERNAQAQVKIVDDILDVARGMAGNLKLELRPLDLVTVAHRGVEAIAPAAAVKKLQVDVHAPQPVAVIGDVTRLQQVIWNLLSNAVKFTPSGGRIAVEVSTADGHAVLKVADTGVGIPAAFLPFVFDKFRQADGSFTRQYGGLGLGLAIARHLIELHGGSIEASSAGEGAGATFVVRLPLPTHSAE